ncbi:MAG: hypothetical protein RJA70_345 [Pseudomonadota bacterium]|jgi:hypothetical protein
MGVPEEPRSGVSRIAHNPLRRCLPRTYPQSFGAVGRGFGAVPQVVALSPRCDKWVTGCGLVGTPGSAKRDGEKLRRAPKAGALGSRFHSAAGGGMTLPTRAWTRDFRSGGLWSG